MKLNYNFSIENSEDGDVIFSLDGEMNLIALVKEWGKVRRAGKPAPFFGVPSGVVESLFGAFFNADNDNSPPPEPTDGEYNFELDEFCKEAELKKPRPDLNEDDLLGDSDVRLEDDDDSVTTIEFENAKDDDPKL